mgnify:CR=1 FL=1
MPAQKAVDLTLDTRVYRLVAMKKAAYRMASRCTAVFREVDANLVSASFSFPPGTSEASATEAVRLFQQELLDEDLRETLREQTDPLRSLILAHAFSKTDLIERS